MSLNIFHLHKESSYHKVFDFLLCMLPFSLPFPMVFNNYIVGLLAGVWLIGGGFKERGKNLLLHKLFFLFISLFLLLIVGLTRTNNIKEAGSTIERALSLIIIPIIVFSSGPYSKVQFLRILKFFIAGCFTSMIFCFIVALYKHSQINYEFEWNIFTVELNHKVDVGHIYYGLYLAFACFCAVYLFIEEKGRYSIFALLFFIATSLLFMLAITAKIAFLSLTFITLLMGFLTVDLKQNWKKILLGSLLVSTFIFLIFKKVKNVERRFQEGFHYSYDTIINDAKNYSSTRMGPLKCALEVIDKNWLFGVGTGDQNYEMTNCYYNHQLDKLLSFNSHNQYLDYMMTFGIGGLFLFLMCLLVPMKLSFNNKFYLYFCFLLLFMLCNTTENMINRNKGVVFYTFFNSLLACYMISGVNEKKVVY